MKRKAATVLVFLLVGCATTPQFIQFSNDIEENYPDTQYLKGIGSAPSLSEAQERAQGNLAKVFSSRIEDDFLINQNRANIDGQETKSEYLSRSVLVSARLDIEGIEIAETFYDKEERVYYALAVLNRNQAESRWQGELREISRQITAIETELNNEPLPYQTIYQLGKLHQAVFNHNLLINRLQIVKPQGGYRHKRDDSERRLRQATQQMSFAVIANQTELKQLAAELLVSEGMEEKEENEASLVVHIEIVELPGTRLDDWFIYRNQLELSAKYQTEPAHKHRWKLQTSSIDQNEASRRMEKTIVETLQEEFFSAIISSLNQGS